MRVGATLEKGSDTLTVRRRKGNKDTLLSEQDVPIPSGEGALAPYLAGADRRFYTRMFSLDHDRLRQGGKEILQAQDDVGQMLFSASAGIMGLRESLKGDGSGGRRAVGLAARGASKVFSGGGAPEIRRSVDARSRRDDEPSGSC